MNCLPNELSKIKKRLQRLERAIGHWKIQDCPPCELPRFVCTNNTKCCIDNKEDPNPTVCKIHYGRGAVCGSLVELL
jgi:hypothetical protein